MIDPHQDDDQVITRLSRELSPFYGPLNADEEGPSPAALKAKIMARVAQEKQWPSAQTAEAPVLERWADALRRFWWMPTLVGAAAALMLVVNKNPKDPTAVLREVASEPTTSQAPSSDEQLAADIEETSQETSVPAAKPSIKPPAARSKASSTRRSPLRISPEPSVPGSEQPRKVSEETHSMDHSDADFSAKRAESAPARSAAPSAPVAAESKFNVSRARKSEVAIEDRVDDEVLASGGAGAPASRFAPRFEVERADGLFSHRLWKRAFEAYETLIKTYPTDHRVQAWKKSRDIAAIRAAE